MTTNYVVGSPIANMVSPATTTSSTTTTTITATTNIQPINIEDFQLFPMILDILSKVKEDEIELIRAINLANETKTKTIETLNKLPGINRSLEDQENLLKSYKQTLKKKEELLEKLNKLEIFQKYNKLKSPQQDGDSTETEATEITTETTTNETENDNMKE